MKNSLFIEPNFLKNKLNETTVKILDTTFFLPDSVDQSKISSRYENGVLLITIPKKKEIVLQNKKKTITIK